MADFLHVSLPSSVTSPEKSRRDAVLGFIIGGILALMLFVFIVSVGYWIYLCWIYGRYSGDRRRAVGNRGRRAVPLFTLNWPTREQITAGILAGLSSIWGFGTMIEERGRAVPYGHQ